MLHYIFATLILICCKIFTPPIQNNLFKTYNYEFCYNSKWKIDSSINFIKNTHLDFKDSNWYFIFDTSNSKLNFVVDETIICKGQVLKPIRENLNSFKDSTILFFPVGKRKVEVYKNVLSVINTEDWGYNIKMQDKLGLSNQYYSFIWNMSGAAKYKIISNNLILTFAKTELYLTKVY